MKTIAILVVALASVSCAGGRPKDCDPTTLVVHGRCFFDKDQACYELGCVLPNQCVEVDGSPPTVECHKVQTQ